jgi:hypothetical protein
LWLVPGGVRQLELLCVLLATLLDLLLLALLTEELLALLLTEELLDLLVLLLALLITVLLGAELAVDLLLALLTVGLLDLLDDVTAAVLLAELTTGLVVVDDWLLALDNTVVTELFTLLLLVVVGALLSVGLDDSCALLELAILAALLSV